MKNRYYLIISIFLYCFLLCTCSPKIYLMDTIKINTGDTITQRLDGNATTGYSWNAVIDNPGIVSLESTIVAVNKDATLMGGPNVFEFKIRGKNIGKTKIHFEYKRTWETGVAPEKTKTIEIEVMAEDGVSPISVIINPH